MTAKELFKYLTEDAGFDEATSKAIMAAADNEKVAAKAGKLKQESEYQSLEQRANKLEAEMNGTKDKPGAKTYQDWYQQNYPAIQKLQQDVTRYTERYGTLDAPNPNPTPTAATTFDPAKIQEMIDKQVDARIQGNYGTQWSNLIKNGGKMVEAHVRAGRKDPIDWDKVGEIAATKGGDLYAAYEDWDAPQRQAKADADKEAEINRRVKEEVAKRNTQSFFPAGADAGATNTVSPLSRHAANAGYDRDKVIESAVTGTYDRKVQ